ncbi:hypothetical protein [Lysobacter solisilvae (ex Woo and Kim 2020)]|uniref:Lipoprotein n=1 Tax=Agrilutibacter terrestris TaxID=2865112 RepID=A0A7H0G0U5_9GAMM|nr:hypothetical protein [Lysobacter terrestris]QNP41911.1 hypothetical protein H8B22_06875 [Lysobacter terrestris]
MTRLFNAFRTAFVLLCLLALAACATVANQSTKFDQSVYAWSGAIRWGDFEGALNLIDPKVREKYQPTPLQLERYKQVQISSYRDVGTSTDFDAGTAVRDIEIGVINRHTMAERTVRYRETWRWDTDAKAWWVTGELPDLWDGQ